MRRIRFRDEAAQIEHQRIIRAGFVRFDLRQMEFSRFAW
jgi:hypothetical protein